MHCAYVLRNEADGRFYIGATNDLRARRRQQGRGALDRVLAVPTVVYHEACRSPDDAYRRERYLKSGRGGRYLRQRMSMWLPKTRANKLERH